MAEQTLDGRQRAVENLVMFGNAFHGKNVWLSGATGFKGSWLAEWLLLLGARVHGYSLPPETTPALFNQLQLAGHITSEINDIRDPSAVCKSIKAVRPDFVFHLAAQPLVRLSYEQPVETYATNVMGTVHVMEALRELKKPCAAVLVTTDKCYENREWHRGYREEDCLGGHDPYSSSKAAAEIAIAAWRRSFFKNHPVRIASARAGNVIGGGDWAKDRIVPDCIRALQKKQPVPVRNPNSTRPWQHVLEPLGGYLWLAASLAGRNSANSTLESAFNFGPKRGANRTVRELVEEIIKHWPGGWTDRSNPHAVHEAKLLHLETAKALRLLKWKPVWNFSETIGQTVAWYRAAAKSPELARELLHGQISGYCADAKTKKLLWAKTNK
ncbi:MAG TPA: CDP-glucose 4,6-dehydratase [Verrucomicrobiae bacterium]